MCDLESTSSHKGPGNKLRVATEPVPINTMLPYAHKPHTNIHISSQIPLLIIIFSLELHHQIIKPNMGLFTFEQETTSTVAPAKLYKALVHDSDDIIPKAVDAIKTVETVEGNGGPGTIKKLTFVEG